MADVVTEALYKLVVTGADQAKALDTSLSSLDKTQEAATASAKKLTAATGEAATVEDRLTKAKRSTVDGLDKLIASMSKADRAQQQYQRTLQQIARYEDDNVGAVERRALATQLATQRLNEQLAAINRNSVAANENARIAQVHTNAIKGVGAAAKLSYTDIEILRAGVVNTAQGLASGASAATTFQTQLFQIGPAILPLIRSIGGIGLAIGGVIAAITAVAGGFALLISRSEQTQARLLNLNAIMSSLGTGGATTAQGLEIITKQLIATGTEAEKARAAIQALARVPGINAGAAATLTPLARDIGSVTGEDFVAVQTRMATAFAKSTAEAIKFVQSVAGPNGLNVSELENMRTMALHGDRAGALQVAISALERQFGGKFQEQMTASSAAITTIGAAWSNMLDKLSETRAVQGARDAIVGMLNAIAGAASGTAAAVAAIPAGPGPGELPGAPPIGAGTGRLPSAADILRNRQGAGLSPADMAVGGALQTLSRGANIGDFNAEVAKRVDYWFNTLLTESERRGLGVGLRSAVRTFQESVDIQRQGGPAATPGQSAHNQPYAIAVDIQGMSASAAAKLAQAGLWQPMPGTDWAHVEPMGTLGTGDPGRLRSFGAFASQFPGTVNQANAAGGTQFRSGMFPNAGQPQPALGTPTLAPGTEGMSSADLEALKAAADYHDRIQKAISQTGLMKTWWDTFNANLDANVHEEGDVFVAMEKANDALKRQSLENQKGAETQQIANDWAIKTADAYGTDLVSGYQKAAQAEAEMAVRNGTANDVASKTTEILRTQAVTAIAGAAQAEAAAKQQTAAQERLAVAADKGLGALHRQQVENDAIAKTQDAYNKALATGDQALIARAKQVTETAIAEAKRLDILKTTTELETKIATNRNSIEVLQLQAKLAGQNTEEVTRQVSLLQAKQELEAKEVPLTSEIAQNYLKSVDAIGRQTAATADAQRAADRYNQTIISIGNNIDTAITGQLEKALSGEKLQDWGKLFKSILNQAQAQMISMSFIKPAIGSVMSLLGMGGAASSFGNLFGAGGGLSGIGSLFGGGGGGTSTPIKLTDDSGKVIGTLSGGGLGGGGGLGNLFGGGGLGGIGDWINQSIGPSLGFSPFSASQLFPGATAAELPAYISANPDIFGGGLFAGSTLTSSLGGVGPGMAVGGLLNTLLGGNQLGGTLGSGVGSVAGSLIGTALFPGVGTILGGLLGGAGGGILGGLFGGGKPKTGPSGGYINIATGEISGAFSGGIPQLDTAAIQVATTVQKLAKNLTDVVGATFPGDLGLRATEKGTFDYQYAGVVGHASDANSAVNQIFMELLKNIGNVSDTMKTVLATVTDPAQVDAAIKFADVYDNIKTAADSAFTGVEDASKRTGPFTDALKQLNDLFEQITKQTEKYGLAIEPVNAALEEATKRLGVDFVDAVDKMFNAATGADVINATQALIDNTNVMLADAKSLGATAETTDKIIATFNAQLKTAFSVMSGPQLDMVIAKFGDLSNELPALAQAAKEAADAAAELNKQTAIYQIQQNYDVAAQQGFLSQLRDLDRQRIAAQAVAKAGGLDDVQSGIIQETEHRAALAVMQALNVDQLELARKTLAELNPTFAAWVDEVKAGTKATQDAADAQARANAIAQAGLQIRQYLNAQQTAEGYTSPADRLAAARGQFSTQLGLAQGGDITALQGITGIADQLKQALLGWFASGAQGQQEWQAAMDALAALPGVPGEQQNATDQIVTAITDTGTKTVDTISDTTNASTSTIVGTTISTNAAIVDNARMTSRDIITATGDSSARIVSNAIETSDGIVRTAITTSASIVGATTTGLTLVTEATTTGASDVVAASNATTTAAATTTTAVAGGTVALLASNEANAKTLIAGSKEDTAALLAQQESNASTLLSANAAQAAALIDQQAINAAKVVDTTNTTAASIVQTNNATSQQIIATATANTDAVRQTANDNTKDILWTANATSKEVASRTEAASASVEAATKAGSDALVATAQSQTTATVSAAYATTDTLGARTEAASAAVAATTKAGSDALVTTAWNTTTTAVGAAYDTTNVLGARTEAASANVAATAKAGSDALLVQGDQQLAAIRAMTGISQGDTETIVAVYTIGNSIIQNDAAWSAAIYGQIAAYGTWAVQSSEAWSSAIVGTIAGWGNATVGTIAGNGNAIFAQIAAYGTWAVQSNESWSNAIIQSDASWSSTIAGTVAGWSTAIYNQIANYGAGTIQTEQAWGAATVQAIQQWGNATVLGIEYWGNADISYQAAAANSNVNMLAAVSNAITNTIYSSDSNVIGAIYGSSSNEIGAAFANGNSVIAAIGSMSVANIAATYSAANSVVASVGIQDLSSIVNSVRDARDNIDAWLSFVLNKLTEMNTNDGYWDQQMFNLLSSINGLLGTMPAMGQDAHATHQWVQFLTDVTVKFAEWTVNQGGVSTAQLQAIEDQLRRYAFG